MGNLNDAGPFEAEIVDKKPNWQAPATSSNQFSLDAGGEFLVHSHLFLRTATVLDAVTYQTRIPRA